MVAPVRPSVSLTHGVEPGRPAPAATPATPVKIDVTTLNFFYGQKRALTDISISVHANVVTAFIGPSGCGKSTFLRTLNRMNDIIAGSRVQGAVTIDGEDIYGPGTDVVALRRRVGMVFQKSNPFPKSIFDNFRNYQRQLLKEYASMADEFGFRVLEGRKSIQNIQD